MNTMYSETTTQADAELTLLHQATSCLEEIIGSFTDEVRAEWDRGKDPKGRTLYTLRLSAWTESVSATFTPRELRARDLRYHLIRLWGDLLQVRSHTLLKNLTKGSDGP
ncbi:MAG TPA: hypothetical protein VN688_20710 [Gemmataceae bacterium]|nr:hypothetical protein [Gemmataceae bacterium]